MLFNEIGVNRVNLTTYRFYCLKRQFCMISKYSKELSFWSINYVSGIKTKFLEYKILFQNKKISKIVSIICTMLVRTLYGAEK